MVEAKASGAVSADRCRLSCQGSKPLRSCCAELDIAPKLLPARPYPNAGMFTHAPTEWSVAMGRNTRECAALCRARRLSESCFLDAAPICAGLVCLRVCSFIHARSHMLHACRHCLGVLRRAFGLTHVSGFMTHRSCGEACCQVSAKPLQISAGQLHREKSHQQTLPSVSLRCAKVAPVLLRVHR